MHREELRGADVDAITMGMQPEYRAARRHRARMKRRPATGTMDNGQRLAAIDVYNLRKSLLSNQQSQLDLQHTQLRAQTHCKHQCVGGSQSGLPARSLNRRESTSGQVMLG